ncbi:hypothetical protein Tco_0270125 [Tanacetum coccineum]
MKAWLKFKQTDAVAKITAHGGIMYRIDKKIITQLSKGLALFCLLSRPSTSRIRWQDGVTAKLKTENPSLDTSIRQDGVTAKLRTRNSSLDTSISASLERNLDAKALMLAINQSPIVFTRPSTSRGTNCPVALDRQDGVTAKLKTENPSLDTSIRILYLNKLTNDGIAQKSLESWKVSPRKADYLFKLRSVTRKITINPVTEKFQRLQTLIISSHKWLRCQAYTTKVYDVEIIVRTHFLPECNVTRFNAFV